MIKLIIYETETFKNYFLTGTRTQNYFKQTLKTHVEGENKDF